MALFGGLRGALLPTKSSATNVTSRVDDYGGQFTVPGLVPAHTQAYEGSHFVARAIPAVGGTGVVAGSFVTVFSDTAKLSLSLRNNEVAGGKTYILDFVKARVIVAPTNCTSVEARAEVDTINRYTSGGTALVVYKGNPSASAPASLATVFSGDITAPAAGSARQHVGQSLVKKVAAPCLVVGETFLFTFNGAGASSPNVAAGPVAATAIGSTIPLSPCSVPPVGTFLFQIATIAADTTAMQWDFEIGWTER